eukprot:596360-Rhodomonas_salina.3
MCGTEIAYAATAYPRIEQASGYGDDPCGTERVCASGCEDAVCAVLREGVLVPGWAEASGYHQRGCLERYLPTGMPYAPTTRCPVLIFRMPYAPPTRCPVLTIAHGAEYHPMRVLCDVRY